VARILLIDDDADFAELLRQFLQDDGHQVTELNQPDEVALREVSSRKFDLLLLDHLFPGGNGIDFLKAVRGRKIHIPAILMTGHGDGELASAAYKMGDCDYLAKPGSLYEGLFGDKLLRLVRKAEETARLSTQPVHLPDTAAAAGTAEPRLLGDSESMHEVYRRLAQVATGNDPVLIYGESGTGKELVARALFHLSDDRKGKPFLPVRCATFSENQLDLELFGHERGYAGLDSHGGGALEKADGGAVLLDEIGDMSLSTQCRLLRFLDERQFTRLGGATLVRPDVRIIATTSRHLEEMGEAKFRQALCSRLKKVYLRLPRLAEREGDVKLLAEHFLRRAAAASQRPAPLLDPKALAKLQEYEWPGNVRELENAIAEAVLGCLGPLILAGALHLGPRARKEGEVAYFLRRAAQAAEESGHPLAGRLNEILNELQTEGISPPDSAPGKPAPPPAKVSRSDPGPTEPDAMVKKKDLRRARAMTLIPAHPDWTVERLARELGCAPATLYRDPIISRLLEGRSASPPPRGFKISSGDVEAYDE
jgi:DNA-binding NtrC family response regulator